MHQQLLGYKVEEKLEKRLNATGLKHVLCFVMLDNVLET
jgi:hypothetical protein